jgi:UDP-N-acetylglucosamine--N-acetylmuramyl-(pentapeptide) pyrophosphoryl-undecaprenol N-acetylglucosamine transferase
MAFVVALAGGGSAGHVVPALALADAILKAEPDTRLRFVGTEGGQEERLVPAAGHALDVVPSLPMLGRSPLGLVRGVIALLRGVASSRQLFRADRPDLVIGVGGYASVPAVLAAATLRLPIALLEPNALPGRANRLLGRLARRVCVQFDDAIPFFPAGRALRLGFPVREIPRSNGGDAGQPLRILVMGGSQGSRAINRALLGDLPRLRAFRITHQTGAHDVDEVRAAYAAAGIDAEIAAFFDDMPTRLAKADVLIARAGASTIAETCMAGIASVLVPLPLADDHQMANARELERAGACRVVPNAEAADNLVSAVLELLADDSRRERMARAAAERAQPDAAALIWTACRELIVVGGHS